MSYILHTLFYMLSRSTQDLKKIEDDDRTIIAPNLNENLPVTGQDELRPNRVERSKTRDLDNARGSQPTQINNSTSSIKKILISLPIILLLGIGYAVYKSTNQIPDQVLTTIDKWNTYEDSNNNFKFIYPPDWPEPEREPITGDVHVLYEQNEKIYDLAVSVDSITGNISLDQYSALLAKSISNQESISVPITSSQQQIANREGRKLVYSTLDQDLEKQVQINFTESNQKIYIIRITTANLDSSWEQEITGEIIESFEINN